MTKRRTPESIHDALDQAIGYVGIERIAAMIGKSTAMIRKFVNPDDEHHLQLRSALEIDRQLALSGDPQPFAELVEALAERGRRAAQQLAQELAEAGSPGGWPAERPMALATRAMRDLAALVDAVEQAEADGVYTAAEVDALREQITALQGRLPRLKRTLTARALLAPPSRRAAPR